MRPEDVSKTWKFAHRRATEMEQAGDRRPWVERMLEAGEELVP
jgi:hypothetical protein